MKFIDAGEAVSAVDGEVRPAAVAVCEQCNGDAWRIFKIDGKHEHIECLGCGMSYCDGSCTAKVPAESGAR